MSRLAKGEWRERSIKTQSHSLARKKLIGQVPSDAASGDFVRIFGCCEWRFCVARAARLRWVGGGRGRIG